MIINASYNGIGGRVHEVLEIIREQKDKDPNYKVIDLGASANNWAWEALDATVDILPQESLDNKKHFQGNLNHLEVWSDLLDYVSVNGKFDFAICTHTLEDISNPGLVAKQLPRIAKSGFVSTPSKFVECGRWGASYMGWYHHRWIFNYETDKIVAYPKMTCIEYYDYFDKISCFSDRNVEELSYFWENNIELEIIQDDFFPENNLYDLYQRLIPRDSENPLHS